MNVLTKAGVRRLALARAGLLKPEWTGLPQRAVGTGRRARRAAHAIVGRFGYLQLDTVCIAGARSHAIVLMSRLEGMTPVLAEQLLQPGQPLFEYWGHEASWLPLQSYPLFEFRRRQYRHHPWWGDVLRQQAPLAQRLLDRVRGEGPIRSLEMEGAGSRGWWDLKLAKQVAAALWSSGELAIGERRNFQRSFDLTERVIPESIRSVEVSCEAALDALLLQALNGHGWATTGTLAATWRLRSMREAIGASLDRLVAEGKIVPCALQVEPEKTIGGWIQPADMDLADRLRRARPRPDTGVLLSPFDPVLWDRGRVAQLFDFDQVLEIYKPAAQRKYGYYCLPVLAGDRLVARVDLKANVREGTLAVLSCRYERRDGVRAARAADAAATSGALHRYARSVGLTVCAPAGL